MNDLVKPKVIEIIWHHDEGQKGKAVRICSVDAHPKLLDVIATCGEDKLVRIWKLGQPTGEHIEPDSDDEDYEVMEDEINHRQRNISWNEYSVHYIGVIGKKSKFKEGFGNVINTVRFSPDGLSLVVGGDGGLLELINPSTFVPFGHKAENCWYRLNGGRLLTRHKMRYHTLDVTDISWSSDSKRLCSVSVDRTLAIWDMTDGNKPNQPLQVFKDFHAHSIQGVAMDPLTHYLATLSADASCIISAATGSGRHLFEKLTAIKSIKSGKKKDSDKMKYSPLFARDHQYMAFFRRLEFSPDGALLVTPSGIAKGRQGLTHVFARHRWNAPCFSLRKEDNSTDMGCFTSCVRFSPNLYKLRTVNGKVSPKPVLAMDYRMFYAVGSIDRSVVIYDTQHHQPLCVMKDQHILNITDIAWAENKLIISSSDGFCSIVMLDPELLGQKLTIEEYPSALQPFIPREITDEPAPKVVEPTMMVPESDDEELKECEEEPMDIDDKKLPAPVINMLKPRKKVEKTEVPKINMLKPQKAEKAATAEVPKINMLKPRKAEKAEKTEAPKINMLKPRKAEKKTTPESNGEVVTNNESAKAPKINIIKPCKPEEPSINILQPRKKEPSINVLQPRKVEKEKSQETPKINIIQPRKLSSEPKINILQPRKRKKPTSSEIHPPSSSTTATICSEPASSSNANEPPLKVQKTNQETIRDSIDDESSSDEEKPTIQPPQRPMLRRQLTQEYDDDDDEEEEEEKDIKTNNSTNKEEEMPDEHQEIKPQTTLITPQKPKHQIANNKPSSIKKVNIPRAKNPESAFSSIDNIPPSKINYITPRKAEKQKPSIPPAFAATSGKTPKKIVPISIKSVDSSTFSPVFLTGSPAKSLLSKAIANGNNSSNTPVKTPVKTTPSSSKKKQLIQQQQQSKCQSPAKKSANSAVSSPKTPKSSRKSKSNTPKKATPKKSSKKKTPKKGAITSFFQVAKKPTHIKSSSKVKKSSGLRNEIPISQPNFQLSAKAKIKPNKPTTTIPLRAPKVPQRIRPTIVKQDIPPHKKWKPFNGSFLEQQANSMPPKSNLMPPAASKDNKTTDDVPKKVSKKRNADDIIPFSGF